MNDILKTYMERFRENRHTASPGCSPDAGEVSSTYFYHIQCTRTATKNTVF